MNDFRLPADEALLRALNGLGWDWLDSLWVALSSRPFGIGIAVLFGGWLLATLKRKALRPVLQATLACLLADAIGHNLLKPYFNRLRPHFALPQEAVRHWAEATATGPSLPSLHAATSFAFVVGLGLVLPWTLRITLPVAVLISLSRIGVGVHWPSDVLAGAALGSIVALLIHLLFQRGWPKG
ncbi:MAG: phosphoesterase PA-phosphatase related [Myxococcaceae bacterium]|nr:phosphoesterase PA-phosphatase related [Myxococcaceae bacterium]